MRSRLAKLAVTLVALGLIAVGVATFAFAGSKTPLKTHPVAQVKAATDGDNIQQGDQTTPDTTAAAAEVPGVESESASPDADQAAQDAACATAGVDSAGANVQYDGSTCSNNG